MSKMICAFTAPTHPSRVAPFVRMYNDGEIDAELVPQGTLGERIRAAAVDTQGGPKGSLTLSGELFS